MKQQLKALVKITGNAGFAAPDKARGCSVTRSGAGVYPIALGQAIDANDCLVVVTEVSGTPRIFSCADSAAGATWTLTVQDAAAAATDTFEAIVAFYQVAGA